MVDYLDALPEQIEYVLRIDEDALFMTPVDGDELNAIADLMVRENLAYVSLVPVRRNLAGRIVEYFRRKLDKRPLRLDLIFRTVLLLSRAGDLEAELSSILVAATRDHLGI